MKRKWLLLPLLIVVAVVVMVFREPSRGADPKLDKSLLTTVKKGDLEVTVLETGKVEPKAQAQVKSRVGGQVTDVAVVEGQPVKKGQVLVKLETTDYRREVARTEAEIEQQRLSLEYAELTLKRSERSKEAAIGTDTELDQARNNAALARARIAAGRVALATAQDRLRYTQIEAPIDGTVTQRNINPGETVVPGVTATFDGKPLLIIADLRTLIVKIDLNQIDVAKVKPGQEAEITLDALPGKKFVAHVTKVAPAAVKATGMNAVDAFPVEATLDPGPDIAAIKPGMTADVRIKIETMPGVLLLPIEAVVTEKGKSSVTLVEPGAGRAKTVRRDVELGARNDREVEVKSGVKVGDQIQIKPPAATEVKF